MQAQSEDRYFTTAQDQDAVLGRLMREHQALEATQAALGAEADRISANLIALGKALRNPAAVMPETEEAPAEFDSQTFRPFRVSLFDLEEVKRILPLCRDYRETVIKLRSNKRRLEEAGWKK